MPQPPFGGGIAMFSCSRLSGDTVWSEVTAEGKFEVFEHLLGVFKSRHEQGGHFISAEIRVCFNAQDPLAARSLGDIELWRALAFRGLVDCRWEDLLDERLDRAVILSYHSECSGERTDFEDLEAEARLDLGALDAFLGHLLKRHLQSLHEAEAEADR